jgi:hypothetical protein
MQMKFLSLLSLGYGQKFPGIMRERIQGQTQRRVNKNKFIKAKKSESTLLRWENGLAQE